MNGIDHAFMHHIDAISILGTIGQIISSNLISVFIEYYAMQMIN